jgi:molybdopterin-guanine dinucleotide biosynthesis protein A
MILLILSGGKSRRMGCDKLLLTRPDGIRQIDWLAGLAKATGCEVMLSRRDDSSPPVDLPVIADLHPGGGPLAALAAAHAARPDQPVLMLGGDLFLLDAATLKHLLDHRDPARRATAFANRIDGRPEPHCAIYEVSGSSLAAGWLARGDFHARHFLESLEPRVLDLPQPAALDGANTPHELAECFAKLERGVRLKTVIVRYSRSLHEVLGQEEEQIETLACTVAGLYEELRFRNRLDIRTDDLQANRDGRPLAWDEILVRDEVIDFTLKGGV